MTQTLLVYIPCHKDFNEAIVQAGKLRKEFEIYAQDPAHLYKRLEIVISVNHFEPDAKDKARAEEICDEVLYYGDAFLFDVNISQGFLVAIRRKPALFWLLSANDVLVAGSLTAVLLEFERDLELDLVVANSLGTPKSFLESQILNPQPVGYHYGLISGVIYRTMRTGSYFNVAPFFPWTGWSQLAVIQSAMNGNDSLKISSLPVESFFSMPEGELEHNAKHYAHSFLGGLIQTSIFEESVRKRRKFLRHFVLKNFYLHHFFSQRDSVEYDKSTLINSTHYLSWNRDIAESLIKSLTPITYLLYQFLKSIPFEKGANNKVLLAIKKRL